MSRAVWMARAALDGPCRPSAFFRQVSAAVGSDVPIVFVYDSWDRKPYETPFGPMPPDLAVRLFYLERDAIWYLSPRGLVHRVQSRFQSQSPPFPLAVVGRDRDVTELARLGRVRKRLQGPSPRWDRTHAFFVIEPRSEPDAPLESLATRSESHSAKQPTSAPR